MSEFQNLLNKFGIIRNKNEVLNMMKIIDKDGNNHIEYKEIIDFLNNSDSYKNENEDAICDAFYIIDNSKKGYITLTDLLFYIRKIGLDLSYNTIIEDFQFEDKNKNEKIDLNEFRYMVLRKDSFTNFKIIAELLIFVDKVEIKTSLNSIYPVSEDVINISLFLKILIFLVIYLGEDYIKYVKM